jgi:hypothetical protein
MLNTYNFLVVSTHRRIYMIHCSVIYWRHLTIEPKIISKSFDMPWSKITWEILGNYKSIAGKVWVSNSDTSRSQMKMKVHWSLKVHQAFRLLAIRTIKVRIDHSVRQNPQRPCRYLPFSSRPGWLSALKQGTGNPGIRESGNPGIGESGNPGIGESDKNFIGFNLIYSIYNLCNKRKWSLIESLTSHQNCRTRSREKNPV